MDMALCLQNKIFVVYQFLLKIISFIFKSELGFWFKSIGFFN